ncbi:hypothetical protein ACFFRL_04070 [Agromyces hippuratus]|uniref:hypothetical protein n=1 Tax=Agromyces hippuratus TaxID=286438 RepID=UPI0035E83059
MAGHGFQTMVAAVPPHRGIGGGRAAADAATAEHRRIPDMHPGTRVGRSAAGRTLDR